MIAHMACVIRKKKYIIDVRDIYPDVYFAQGLIRENSILGRFVKRMTSSMYSGAHGVLSVTPGLVQKIKRLSPLARVELLINGYDRELFSPSKEKFTRFTVIFHGNMGKIQNIPVILSVAKLLEEEEIDFIFIGEGPQAELFKKDLPKNVKYLGSKNYSEIPSFIAKAHIGFSARRDDDIGADAFPVKVFEYIGVGIPVIMTPANGMMLNMVQSGIYEFQNSQIEEMAKKILEIKNTGEGVILKDNLSRQDISKKILEFCDFN
jgi:glycosyltransferase involved in cell wall biosynthesis